MATYFIPVMSEHALQTNSLGFKTYIRCTHIALFIISFCCCCCCSAFCPFLLLQESCFVITGADDVEGDNGASISSLPDSWKGLRTNILEVLASTALIRAVLLQEAHNFSLQA